jgi:CBS domain-containing protein
MAIGEVCSSKVYVVGRNEPLAFALREMQRRGIGSVVVVESRGKLLFPVGIVTDRDVWRGQVMRQAGLFALTVEDVMTSNPLTLLESSGLAEAVGSLRARGVRRAPVVASTGELIGMVSVDDLLPPLAAELRGLAQLQGTQTHHAA